MRFDQSRHRVDKVLDVSNCGANSVKEQNLAEFQRTLLPKAAKIIVFQANWMLARK